MLCLLPVPCLGCVLMYFLLQRVARAGPGCIYCRLMRAEQLVRRQPATYSRLSNKPALLVPYMPLAKSSTARQLIRKARRDKAEEVVSDPE